MLKVIILFIFAAVITADPLKNQIHLTQNAKIEEFPYQVGIQRFGESYCSGVIVSEKMILTAATCSAAVGRTIRSGSTFDNKNGTLHSIIEIIRHEKFVWDDSTDQVPVYNIMLLRVNEPFVFNETRQPILLPEPDEDISTYDVGYLTGWGMFEDDDSPHALKKISVPILSEEKCNESYSSTGGIQNDQFCTSPPETREQDSCFKFLGSPLTVSGRVFGILAWEKGCEKTRNYQVYTKIAPYVSWIQEKLY
ncbi:trypsin-5-like [Cotesia glomerata]|uniref:trypsin-5-like n=1 Tax=Cotesia glomerata TaxID=32391 RepID=UPI001D01DB81|nr:trypsin-5-like [Cotesia glomerata]